MIFALVVGASLATVDAARAGACPEGNLLAGRQPVRGALRSSALLTDGIVAKSGNPSHSPLTTRFPRPGHAVVWDLGQVVEIHALIVQAQANVVLDVSLSHDGSSFTPLWEVQQTVRGRMQTRRTTELTGEGRFIRVSQRGGVVGRAISEVQAFCVTPDPWPPKLEVRDAEAGSLPRERFKFWGKLVVGGLGLLIFVFILVAPTQKDPKEERLAWQLAAGSAAALLTFTAIWSAGAWGLLGAVPALGLGGWLVWRRQPGAARQLLIERVALVIVIAAGAIAYVNFGTFHGRMGVHLWDSFHYVLGAKYFPENGYTGLYDCTLLAEAENGHAHEMPMRKARDLRDNVVRPATELLAEGPTCRAAFSDERWLAFRHDVARFRASSNPEQWLKQFNDHGFNASPVWLTVGHPIANWSWRDDLGPSAVVSPQILRSSPPPERNQLRAAVKADREAFYGRLRRLAWLDGLLYLGILALLYWAFGLRAVALAALVWGTGHPWTFDWTGGSFGRMPWLFTATAGLALIKKGKPTAGGFALAGSLLLRVFPGALAGGLLFKGLWTLIRRRQISRPHRRLLLGGAIGLGLLVPVSLASMGGTETYAGFINNSLKHNATRLTNHVGLDTILGWHPERSVRHTKDPTLDDKFAVWREQQIETLASRRPWRWLLVAGLFALVALVAVRVEDWEAVAISTLLIFCLVQLTNYYYAMVILMAPVALRRLRYVVAFTWLAIIGQGVGTAVGWVDEESIVHSLLILAFFIFLLVDLLVQKLREERAEAPAAPAPAPAPTE